MNILYLHGLESKLSPEKRLILEKYGSVIAPDLDYKSNPNMIEFLYDSYHNQNIDLIIGSSMGGFAGFYLSNLFGVPCLLYNPALPYRTSIKQIVPSNISVTPSPFIRIVLGALDNVIKAKDNLAYFPQIMSNKTDYTISIRKDLAHQIPIDTFQEESKAFFDSFN